MRKSLIGLIATMPLVVAGCAPGITIGDAPSDPPPSLTQTDAGPIWSNISSFGPVPPGDTERAAAVCATLNTDDGDTFSAFGYHPNATNLANEPIPGGGFFCLRN